MPVKRHICYICNRKRYRSKLDKLPVLNISIFHMSWTNTYICRPELGYRIQYRRGPDGIGRPFSVCQDKHQDNINLIIQQFDFLRSGQKVSSGSDNLPEAKMSKDPGHFLPGNQEAKIDVKFITGIYGCKCHPFDSWDESNKAHKQKLKDNDHVKNRCSGKHGCITEVFDMNFYMVRYVDSKYSVQEHAAKLIKQ